jgi:hypothetical protein
MRRHLIFAAASIAAGACEAAPRMPYAQALAICQGRAAEIMANAPVYTRPRGIIGFWVIQNEEQRREAAIVKGCLAEYRWVVR